MSFDEPPAVFLDRRMVERAESTAEGDQVVVTELLVAKQHDRMVKPRAIDLRKHRVINRSEIDAADFRAECRSGRNNVETRSYRHIEYGKIPDSNRRVEQA